MRASVTRPCHPLASMIVDESSTMREAWRRPGRLHALPPAARLHVTREVPGDSRGVDELVDVPREEVDDVHLSGLSARTMGAKSVIAPRRRARA